jgi:hypothetical protein
MICHGDLYPLGSVLDFSNTMTTEAISGAEFVLRNL